MVSLKSAAQIGGFPDIVSVASMDALDQGDVVHHRENGEKHSDLSLDLRFSTVADRNAGLRRLRPAAFVRASAGAASRRLGEGWRRGRDSNPRFPCENTCFPSTRIRPLCHLSGVPRAGVFPQPTRLAKGPNKGLSRFPGQRKIWATRDEGCRRSCYLWVCRRLPAWRRPTFSLRTGINVPNCCPTGGVSNFPRAQSSP